MKLASIQVGKPKKIKSSLSNEWWDKDWETGFYKRTVNSELWLGYKGLKGDGQSDLKNHGGVDKAVCVYPIEHYAYWNKEFKQLDFNAGAFGENFTTTGLLEAEVCIGDIYSIGTALVQVTQPRQPCYKLARRWKVKDLANLVQSTGKTGFYFRVIENGYVVSGNVFKLIERMHENITISYCNNIMHIEKNNCTAALELSKCVELSASWKDTLYSRYLNKRIESPERRLSQINN
jgi:MOSC domain-containing protein YiiM